MGRDVSNPLQGLIRQAAAQLPTKTGTTERFARRLNAVGPRVLVADVSGSMSSPAWSGRSKASVLGAAVADLMRETPAPCLIAFSSRVYDRVSVLPEPNGTTALHLALACAVGYQPGATLVISDGQPDDEQHALAQAERLSGRIDTLYVGPDSDRAAIDFMRRLARVGCGRDMRADLGRPQPRLGSTIRQLLLSAP